MNILSKIFKKRKKVNDRVKCKFIGPNDMLIILEGPLEFFSKGKSVKGWLDSNETYLPKLDINIKFNNMEG